MAASVIQVTPQEWDRFVEARGGHLLQTARWGALKRAFGWQDEIVTVGSGGQVEAGALLLFRRLPLGLGTLAYVPRGPLVDWHDAQAVSALFAALEAAARRRRAFLLKVEPDERDTPALRERLAALGLRESAQTVQPPRTILVDITGSEDDVLARMSQTTRRKVRVAARKEVSVREGSSADIEPFNRMMATTGARNEFGVHSPAYYRLAYDLFVPEHAALLFASYQGKDLAGLFVFALGRTAWYLYGASSDAERQRMPAYALQWEAMRWARARGCTAYDLWGIPDADEAALEAQFQQRQDGLWGVYGFKRGFGGDVVRCVGAWDRPYNPLLYAAYRLFVAWRGGAEG
jgi:peptidoglycan pentaglycine glycine transferase (the first glycine)